MTHKMQGTDACLGKRFGHAKAIPCPLCNKSGQNVAKKLAEIRRLNNDSKI